MTRSKIFLNICLSFVAGIAINSLVPIPQILMLGVLILGLLLISVFWGSNPIRGEASNGAKKIALLGFCLLFLIAGAWRHQLATLAIKNSALREYNDSGKEIIISGRVVKEPDIRENNIKLTIVPEKIYFHTSKYGSKQRIFKEKILVTIARYPEYEYGDKLRITARLASPMAFSDFNYRDYLAKDGIYSVSHWPKIEVLARNQGNFFYAKILSLKERLSQNINKFLSPPQSSILLAMLLGEQKKMSEGLKEKLNIVGLRHITAVSGMHVAILTNILLVFLIGLGFSRSQAFYWTIILIALFIILTGLPASAVRAGIMGGFLLLAQHLGRLGSSSRGVVFAATLMLFHNPLLLRLDIGFQLSFLAVLGIIYLGPLFRNLLSFLPKEKFIGLNPVKSPAAKGGGDAALPQFNWVKDILVMTLSAYLFTLPLLLYNFGQMSLVAPLSNILVLPFLPLLMMLGFVLGLSSLIWQSLAWVFSWPLWLLLSYVIKAIEGLSSFSFSSLSLKISWPWLFGSYLVLGFFSFWLSKRYRMTRLGININEYSER